MRIYLARAIKGAATPEQKERQRQVNATFLCALANLGHQTQFMLPYPRHLTWSTPSGHIAQRDLYWIEHCDALFAEVTYPSHGVGYEIAHAAQHQKPIWLFADKEADVSSILTGLHGVHGYRDLKDLENLIERAAGSPVQEQIRKQELMRWNLSGHGEESV